MTETFGWVIRTYGQKAVCHREDGSEIGRGMAIVRPMTELTWQMTAGALGSSWTDRYLGLAEPELPVDQIGLGGWLSWGGENYEIMSTQSIRVGDKITHLWLALRPAGEIAP